MSRRTDSACVSIWQGRLERFSDSKLRVGAFCEREGVTVASFYYWRKKLGVSGRDGTTCRTRGSFQRVSVLPVGHEVSIQLAGGSRLTIGSQDAEGLRMVLKELMRADRALDLDAESC